MSSSRSPKDAESIDGIKVFHDVARALASSLDLDAILLVIMEQMARFFEPESWSLLISDEGRRSLYYAISAGKPMERESGKRIAMGEGVAGLVAQRGQPMVLPDAVGEIQMAADSAPSGARSAICLPLRWRETTVGAIEMLNYRASSMTGEAMEFLQVLTDYAAIAIQNARAMQRVRELTITDDCTGLFNSRHLASVLAVEIERSRRFRLPFSLIFMDLDYFKRVNDEHGHLAGSWLLAQASQTIKSCIRGIDSAFRYGGDEFIVLLPQTSKDAALEVALRLLRAFRASRYPRPREADLTVRASIGLAAYPEDGSSGEEIVSAADATMYLVKNSTRDNISVAQGGPLTI